MTYITNLPSETQWIDFLINTAETALKRSHHVVIIVISRRMAQLWKFYAQEVSRLRNFMNRHEEISIITEYAIATSLNGKTPENTEVIILNDLIVPGDISETVSEYVFYITGIRSKIIALGAYDKEKLKLSYGDIVYPIRDIHPEAFISKNKIPAFTARNSWKIINTKLLINPESCVFKIRVSDSDKISSNLEGWLKSIFTKAIVYSVKHSMETLSISVCFPKGADPCIQNSDFVRFRFFIGNNYVKVVFTSPSTWSELDLKSGKNMFLYSGLNKCWNEYCQQLESITIPKHKEEDSTMIGILKGRFDMHLQLCKVVWANYLRSFETAILFKDELYSVISKMTENKNDKQEAIQIDKQGLNLLIGDEIIDYSMKELQSVIDCEEEEFDIMNSRRVEISNKAIIPDGDLDDYNRRNMSNYMLAPTVEVALSLTFFQLWERYDLINNRKREDRIHAGETIDSLLSGLSKVYTEKKDELLLEIWKWVDSRIDTGSVVPKYEYTEDRLGYHIWRRYFRAGNREDILIDVVRLMSEIAFNKFGKQKFTFEQFKTDVFGPLTDISNQHPGQLDILGFNRGICRYKRTVPSDTPPENNTDLLMFIWMSVIIFGGYTQEIDYTWDIAKVSLDATLDSPKFSGSPIFEIL